MFPETMKSFSKHYASLGKCVNLWRDHIADFIDLYEEHPHKPYISIRAIVYTPQERVNIKGYIRSIGLKKRGY